MDKVYGVKFSCEDCEDKYIGIIFESREDACIAAANEMIQVATELGDTNKIDSFEEIEKELLDNGSYCCFKIAESITLSIITYEFEGKAL
jgi:hypothetical protein